MDKNKESAVDEFFSKLPKDDGTPADVFDEKKVIPPVSEKKEDIDPEDVEESVKNRRHRRLEQKLQSEREANIALNERVSALAEIAKVSKETDGKIDPRLLRAFGTNDAGKEAAQVFQELLVETAENARRDALKEIEQEKVSEMKEQKKYENYIDEQLESIEDAYGIDLTSENPKASKIRSEFLDLIQELSPKDEDGVITDYADFGSTFEIYQKTNKTEKPDTTRQREIASRSIQRSGGSGAPQAPTPGFHGWKKDYNM